MTTILTLIFLVCIVALKGLNNDVRATADDLELERAAMTAEAEAAYFATTEPFAPDSLKVGGRRISLQDIASSRPLTTDQGEHWTPLKLDGRPYVWTEGDVQGRSNLAYDLGLQDEAGLLNIDTASPLAVANVFEMVGVAPRDAATLATELRDYVSIDGAEVADGASDEDYVSAGYPRPLRRPAERLSEIYGVLNGTKLATPGQWRAAERFFAVVPDNRARNVNTAPPEVLTIEFGIGPDQAKALIAERETRSFSDLSELGVTKDSELASYTFPDGRIRFTFVDPRTGSVYRSTLVMTPGDFSRPIWTEDPRLTHGVQTTTARDTPARFPSLPR